MAEVYPHPKMNARQWVANFWYHYRWQFLFGVVAVTFILIATVQFFRQKEPDAVFLYVGPQAVSDRTCKEIVGSAKGKFTRDYDGNGYKGADINTIQLDGDLEGLSPHKKAEADKRLRQYTDEILSGDSCFLLLTPALYEKLDEEGALVSIYEIYGAWRDVDVLLCGIPLSDIPLGKCAGFSDLPRDTILCLKYAGTVNGALSEDEIEARNARNAEIFRDLCD
ncbi:MAG: hypothetical protein J6Z79_05530 [Clostridia bacterium]|nr:hypothetical protein [Clostridia bacterium]